MGGAPIPSTWEGSEIISIFKKGLRSPPANYWSISLLHNLQKMFCRHILDNLQAWIEEANILTAFQAGFRKKTSTVDQAFRFQMLRWKTVYLNKGSLHLTFVDLKATFDMVSRPRLWEILKDMGIPSALVNIIIKLHHSNYAQIRWGEHGETTGRVKVTRGVRQGCVLAPTLFLLFINGCVDFLLTCGHDVPIVGELRTPTLLFADDSQLISKTQKGLGILLNRFDFFCSLNSLALNPGKTKFMVINPRKNQETALC